VRLHAGEGVERVFALAASFAGAVLFFLFHVVLKFPLALKFALGVILMILLGIGRAVDALDGFVLVDSVLGDVAGMVGEMRFAIFVGPLIHVGFGRGGVHHPKCRDQQAGQ